LVGSLAPVFPLVNRKYSRRLGTRPYLTKGVIETASFALRLLLVLSRTLVNILQDPLTPRRAATATTDRLPRLGPRSASAPVWLTTDPTEQSCLPGHREALMFSLTLVHSCRKRSVTHRVEGEAGACHTSVRSKAWVCMCQLNSSNSLDDEH
jgi:hypothetical protein